MPHRPPRVRAALALVATAALTSTLLASYAAPTASAGPAGPGDRTPASRAEQRAVAALDHARALVAGRSGGDLTIALKDVANSRDALRGAQRAAADRLLARPDDSGSDGTIDWGETPEAEPVCGENACIHYVASGDDAPSLVDENEDDVPDYVATVIATVDHVLSTFATAGYRAPKADGAVGGGVDKFDVYLGNIDVDGYYGYCAPDEATTVENTDRYDRYSYCGLDNDYAAFTTNTPLANLQVTVAHEFFHATQFAYDAFEDNWLLEATAAWVEDEVYDDVNDNLQYLSRSQLTKPRTSLDTFENGGTFHYGTWSFFRFLTERYPARKGALPKLVLDVFRVVDGAPGGDDNYSWQGVDRVLRAKGTSGAKMLGAYAVANRRATRSYAEGNATGRRYPNAPLVGSATISATRGARLETTLNHLTTATARLTPRSSLGSGYQLQLKLDLQPTAKGSSVLVTSSSKSGKLTTTTVALNSSGDATKRLGFAAGKVAWVEVTLINGSGRFSCWTEGAYSCQGTAKDQKQPVAFTARAIRP